MKTEGWARLNVENKNSLQENTHQAHQVQTIEPGNQGKKQKGGGGEERGRGKIKTKRRATKENRRREETEKDMEDGLQMGTIF